MGLRGLFGPPCGRAPPRARGCGGLAGVLWFGGALRAQCLPVAHAAGVPPRPPKALSGLRSLRSRTAYGVPKGRGRSARDKCSAPLSQCIYRQLRSHKAVSCRGFATASRFCRLTESPWRLNYYAGTIGGKVAPLAVNAVLLCRFAPLSQCFLPPATLPKSGILPRLRRRKALLSALLRWLGVICQPLAGGLCPRPSGFLRCA